MKCTCEVNDKQSILSNPLTTLALCLVQEDHTMPGLQADHPHNPHNRHTHRTHRIHPVQNIHRNHLDPHIRSFEVTYPAEVHRSHHSLESVRLDSPHTLGKDTVLGAASMTSY